jgi:phenylalanyl-tRNA synthetase beta chain
MADRPHEWWRLAFAITGPAEPVAWNRPARAYDLDDAKGIVEVLAGELGLPTVTFAPDTTGYPLHPGRAAVARAGTGLVGRVGEIHPGLAHGLDLRLGRVVVAELAIQGLAGGQLPPVLARAVPRHPAVERDIAVVVPERTPATEVDAAIRDSAGPLLADARLFDIYRGAPLAGDEKSLAFRLTFQADRTLTEGEIEAAVATVTAAIAEGGWHLRA